MSTQTRSTTIRRLASECGIVGEKERIRKKESEEGQGRLPLSGV